MTLLLRLGQRTVVNTLDLFAGVVEAVANTIDGWEV